eukprot:c18338_g2_i1 orf=234-695(-)
MQWATPWPMLENRSHINQKKGIYQWKNLWDGRRKDWQATKVLRQRHKLTANETKVLKEVLEEVPGWFPTNWNMNMSQPLLEWCWSNGVSFTKTTTKVVYNLLVRNESWHIALNTRWKRSDSSDWWQTCHFKVWKGTPYSSINFWNWRMLTGSL